MFDTMDLGRLRQIVPSFWRSVTKSKFIVSWLPLFPDLGVDVLVLFLFIAVEQVVTDNRHVLLVRPEVLFLVVHRGFTSLETVLVGCSLQVVLLFLSVVSQQSFFATIFVFLPLFH